MLGRNRKGNHRESKGTVKMILKGRKKVEHYGPQKIKCSKKTMVKKTRSRKMLREMRR